MPKNVWHDFYLAVKRDIETTRSSGERYLTVRGIASKFGVSLQTAQRAVARLAEEHYVTAKPRSGIIVCNKTEVSPMRGKRVLVLSAKRDRRFYTSFLFGVKKAFEGEDVAVDFAVNDFPSETSLEFGKHILSLGADGIIALAFPNSALPFYHAMREGQDLISDIILDDLPTLPVLQTDNYAHSYEAGRILGTHKCARYYMISSDPEAGNKRAQGFFDGLQKTWRWEERPRMTYIHLASDNAVGNVIASLLSHGRDSAFFIGDWSANYLFGALCLQEGVQPRFSLVYDGDDAYFSMQGLEPIRAVAPPFHELGKRLGGALLAKWQTGSFPSPLQQKI